jgi:hypothetical protein
VRRRHVTRWVVLCGAVVSRDAAPARCGVVACVGGGWSGVVGFA